MFAAAWDVSEKPQREIRSSMEFRRRKSSYVSPETQKMKKIPFLLAVSVLLRWNYPRVEQKGGRGDTSREVAYVSQRTDVGSFQCSRI